MPGRLEGKVAIVTGGGGGFGKAISTKFAAEGAKVMIADYSEEVGQKTASELKVGFCKTNVTDKQQWQNLLDTTIKEFGQLDIVVNNAGTTYRNKPSETVTEEDYDKTMLLNVKAIYLSSVVLLPYFLENNRPGSFVNIASTAGIRPRPGLAWYNASKAAVNNATKSLAVEFGPKQIRWNSVCPVIAAGTGLTELFLGKPDTEENRKAFFSTVPMGRGCTPDDVANACIYLSSEEAAFVTGVNLEVDGGRCI